LSHSSNNHTLSLSYSSDWLMRMLMLSLCRRMLSGLRL
jgi:hypothetical protein